MMRRSRKMDLKKPLDEDVLRIIEFRILGMERKNLKTNDKPRRDADMIGDIVKLIKSEIDRERGRE